MRRNVGVLAASIFGLGLGEELWQAYMPAYLTALGAGGMAVGLFGSAKDLLDSLYQYPGGLLGVMAWKAGAFPTTFAVIGDSLPRDRRATAFSVQSILVRVPRVIGAPLGGLAIASF